MIQPIDAQSPFLAPASISETLFTRVLANAGSPWTADAAAIYDLIIRADQDPGRWLAIAGREHTYGTAADSVLTRNDTRSWTNARSVRDPSLTGWQIITDSKRNSQYVRYASVLDSVRDALYRVTEPAYEYRKRNAHTIDDVISIWTEDDAAGYIASMLSRLALWQAADPEPQIPFIPAQQGNFTPGRPDWPRALVGHHTNGYDSLAELTRSARKVSATYLLWNAGTIRAQLVRHADTQHTTGSANGYTLSYEWERKAGDPSQATITDVQYANIAHSCAMILRRERRRGNPHLASLPGPEWFTKHRDYSDTECPGNLDTARVARQTIELLTPDYAPATPSEISLNGHRIYGGIRAAWEAAGGIAGYGLPITDEADAPATVDYQREQWFERGRAEWAPGRWPDHHDVTWGLLGLELRDMITTMGVRPAPIDPARPHAGMSYTKGNPS